MRRGPQCELVPLGSGPHSLDVHLYYWKYCFQRITSKYFSVIAKYLASMLFSMPISTASQLHLTFSFKRKWYTFTCLLNGASVHSCHLTRSLKATFSPALGLVRYTIRTSHWWHPALRRFLWHTCYTVPPLQVSCWKLFGKFWTPPVFTVLRNSF